MLPDVVRYLGDQIPRRIIESRIRVLVILAAGSDAGGNPRPQIIHPVRDFLQGNESPARITAGNRFLPTLQPAQSQQIHAPQVVPDASAIHKSEKEHKDLVRQDRIPLGWARPERFGPGHENPVQSGRRYRNNVATRPKGRGGGGACPGHPHGGG